MLVHVLEQFHICSNRNVYNIAVILQNSVIWLCSKLVISLTFYAQGCPAAQMKTGRSSGGYYIT